MTADTNLAGETYPNQSLYPDNSGPALCAPINRALLRYVRIEHLEGKRSVADWGLPIVADAEAGFGRVLKAFEVMRAFIEAGAAPASTSMTTSPPRRSADTWAAMCLSPPRSSCVP